MTTSRQVGPSVAQPVDPSAPADAISAPIPSNWPLIPCRLCRYSSGVRYAENGSFSGSIIPLIAPCDQRLAVDRPAGVAVVIVWYVSQNGWNAVASATGRARFARGSGGPSA